MGLHSQSFLFFAGTGEHASQQGMSMGGTRHAYDEDMSPQSQGMLHPQTGNSLFQRKR